MRIKDLIRLLKDYDLDDQVFVNIYECGTCQPRSITDLELKKVVKKDHWYEFASSHKKKDVEYALVLETD